MNANGRLHKGRGERLEPRAGAGRSTGSRATKSRRSATRLGMTRRAATDRQDQPIANMAPTNAGPAAIPRLPTPPAGGHREPGPAPPPPPPHPWPHRSGGIRTSAVTHGESRGPLLESRGPRSRRSRRAAKAHEGETHDEKREGGSWSFGYRSARAERVPRNDYPMGTEDRNEFTTRRPSPHRRLSRTAIRPHRLRPPS